MFVYPFVCEIIETGKALIHGRWAVRPNQPPENIASGPLPASGSSTTSQVAMISALGACTGCVKRIYVDVNKKAYVDVNKSFKST